MSASPDIGRRVRQAIHAAADLGRMTPEQRARGLARTAGGWFTMDSRARQRLVTTIADGSRFSPQVAAAGLLALFTAASDEERLVAWWKRNAPKSGGSPGPWPGILSLQSPCPTAPAAVGIVAAGNIPGVALFPAMAALLAGSAAIVRNSAAEPHLMPAWQDLLRSHAPEMAEAAAVVSWDRGDLDSESAALDCAGRILVFGRDETVAELTDRHPRRVIGCGTGVSFALVGPEASDEAAAAELALDVALWDQQGCLSPHGAYVIGDFERIRNFAGGLAGAMVEVEARYPRGPLSAAEAGQIRSFRADVEARRLAGEAVALWTPGERLDWTVAAMADPDFEPSCLNRTIWIRPLASVEGIVPVLRPLRSILQGAGVTGFADARRVGALLKSAGVSHVARLGDLQKPPVDWPNKGRDLLAEILAGATAGFSSHRDDP